MKQDKQFGLMTKNTFEDIAEKHFGVDRVDVKEKVKTVHVYKTEYGFGEGEKSFPLLPENDGKLYYLSKMVISGYVIGRDDGAQNYLFGSMYFEDKVKANRVYMDQNESDNLGEIMEQTVINPIDNPKYYTETGQFRYYDYKLTDIIRNEVRLKMGRPEPNEAFRADNYIHGLCIDMIYLEAQVY